MKTRVCLWMCGAVCCLAGPAMAQDEPDARAIYMQYCAQCHGEELGGGNAQSMVDGVWLYGAEPGYIFRNIKHGITHLGMPAYESTLTDDEMRALTRYILDAEEAAGAERPDPPSEIQTQDYHIKVEQWATNLEIPWAIAFPDADTALITERPGGLRIVRNGVLDPKPIAGTPDVLHEGQGGLMDVAVDPEYAANGWVYLAYTHGLEPTADAPRALAMTKIVRGRIKDGAWTDEQTLFEADHDSYLPTRIHFGSRIVFDAEGHLYFAIGERGMQDHAQDLSRPNGKVHRIWPDGSIPDDNPFVNTPGAIPSIFSYGNRNPQGLSIHPETGLLWESEHGPMGGDELNVIRAGRNYGWPLITYGRNYNGELVSDKTHQDGLEQPALFWRPSIAVCGIEFYTGDQFKAWQNVLLVTALRNEEVSLARVEGDRVMHTETILRAIGRVRDAGVDPEGAVYVVTNSPDAVLKLTVIRERSY